MKKNGMNLEQIIKVFELEPVPDSSRPDWTRTLDENGEMPIEINKDVIFQSHVDDWDLSNELVEELFDIACSNSNDQVEPIDKEAIWEICGWYQPLHFYGRHWGIYIRKSCIKSLALRIASKIAPTRNMQQIISNKSLFAKDLMQAAFSVIFWHEHFHHKVESLGIRLHVALGYSVYVDYKNNVYSQVLNTDDCLEEALANADSYRRINDKPYSNFNYPLLMKGVVKEYLKHKFRHEPPGYRLATNFLSDEKFKKGLCLLQGQVKEVKLNPIQPSSDWLIAPDLTRALFNLNSKINLLGIMPKGKKLYLPVYIVY